MKKIKKRHIDNGVLIYGDVFIDEEVIIESGAVIYPNNVLKGKTVIKKGVVLNKGNTIKDSEINEGSVISDSYVTSSVIGKKVSVGPFANIRSGTFLGDKCRIGDFVEIKNSAVGEGTKISHLAYVGDADVGKNCNVGCGVVFVNFNGKEKSRSVIGDNSFIGSNCNIIAPVKIGCSVFIAAGTTVTKDLEDGDFCVGRSRETVKKDGAGKYLGNRE